MACRLWVEDEVPEEAVAEEEEEEDDDDDEEEEEEEDDDEAAAAEDEDDAGCGERACVTKSSSVVFTISLACDLGGAPVFSTISAMNAISVRIVHFALFAAFFDLLPSSLFRPSSRKSPRRR